MAGDPPNRRHDTEQLLHQAQFVPGLAPDAQPAVRNSALQPLEFKELTGSAPSGEKANHEMLKDVDLNVQIELGRTQMYLEDVLKLRHGSVVTLDKLAGDPVDVLANGRIVARGEVVVLNDNFCVRVTELVAGDNCE